MSRASEMDVERKRGRRTGEERNEVEEEKVND